MTDAELAAERLAALLDAERENTALRREVSYLRASVPPLHPGDYGHEVWSAALRDAVEAERAAVVAWLREEANEPHPIEAGERALSPSGRGLLLLAASRIERGEHRREEQKPLRGGKREETP